VVRETEKKWIPTHKTTGTVKFACPGTKVKPDLQPLIPEANRLEIGAMRGQQRGGVARGKSELAKYDSSRRDATTENEGKLQIRYHQSVHVPAILRRGQRLPRSRGGTG